MYQVKVEGWKFFRDASPVLRLHNESLDKTASDKTRLKNLDSREGGEKKVFYRTLRNLKKFWKIWNFKFWKYDNSRSFCSISNPKTVWKSVNHKLSFQTLVGAKFKILKLRILIGRKFLKFFFDFFFFNNIKKDWLSSISL